MWVSVSSRRGWANLLHSGALITSSVDYYKQGLTGPAQVVLLGLAQYW